MASTPILVFTLALTSPLLPSLISTHRPFSRPSILPQSQATKWVQRVNAAIISRDTAQLAIEEKRAAVGLAAEVIRQDAEGWALAGWGKGWMTNVLSVIHTPLPTLQVYLDLLLALINASSQYPSFERESVHPIMGKLAIGTLKLLERSLGQATRDWVSIIAIISATRVILLHAPAPFRTLSPALRSNLLPLITAPHPAHASSQTVPTPVRQAALDLFTSLYTTAGKAQASAAWASDMRLVMNGATASMAGVRRDGWDQCAPVDGDIADPTARLPVALDALQGWVDIIVTYLRKPTVRPVPVPIGPIVGLALRCLDLSIDTPVVEYITPQHHAALIASLPRIWGMGMMLVGHLASTCGDHLLPHLAEIVDITTYLAESVPRSMIHLQLLRTHRLLLTLYPPSTLPTETATRLLKDCLSKLSLVLDVQKSSSSGSSSISKKDAHAANGAHGQGKKGKKRARGGEEDGLVGSFEGRAGRKVGDEWEIVVEVLKITPHLHQHPLIAPSLLTLSIRTHLSLHLLLPELPRETFLAPQAGRAVAEAVREALELSATQHGERGGWRMGWTNIVLGVLSPSPSTSAFLHPSVPPLLRPAPPLSALHFYTTETAEEKKLRRELGLKVVSGRRARRATAGGVGEGEGEAEEGASGSDADDSEDESEDDEGDDVGDDENMENGARAANRPRLGGDGASTMPVPKHKQEQAAVAAREQQAAPPSHATLVVPVAPQDVRSGKPSLDLTAAPAASSAAQSQSQPDEVLVLADPVDDSQMEVDDKEQEQEQETPDFIAFTSTMTSVSTTIDKGKGKMEVVEAGQMAVIGGTGAEEDEEDEGIPELDSGMSDFEEDDEDEDDEEEDEEVEMME